MHDRPILSRPALARDWHPELPTGTLRSVLLHWTAGDYETVFDAYHFCLSGAVEISVHATHDLRANMRDVRHAAAGVYAAHTAGRNSYAVGIAVCAMAGATPHAFGEHPITAAQIHALCSISAYIARWYRIDIACIQTHAEVALSDGYFGAGADDRRWDLARLEPSAGELLAAQAGAAGDYLRAQIAALR